MRYHDTGNQPVYSLNSLGGPTVHDGRGEDHIWHADGEMLRAAYALHAEDDFTPARHAGPQGAQ